MDGVRRGEKWWGWDVRGVDVTEEGVLVGDQRRLVRRLSLGVVAHRRFGRHCRGNCVMKVGTFVAGREMLAWLEEKMIESIS